MEAKDTVIEGEHLADLVAMDNAAGPVDAMGRWGEEKREAAMLQAQAEISFKAGREVGNSKGFKFGVIAGELLGRREVVEWVKKNRETPLGKDPYGYYVWEVALDVQCKEWGL